MIALLLISDLDGTWLPAPGEEGALAQLETVVAAKPGIHLAFATGRTLSAAVEGLATARSRGPHTLITDVGCALHHPAPGGEWREDPGYAAAVTARWNQKAADRVVARLPEGIVPQQGVAPVRRLALQVETGFDPVERAAPLRALLSLEGLVARVLPSHGFYLDVLPEGVDKGFAVRYLQNQLRSCHVVSCGDSENDLDLFRAADTALLMPQHHLEDGHLDELAPTLIRCAEPGPRGILAELRRLGHL